MGVFPDGDIDGRMDFYIILVRGSSGAGVAYAVPGSVKILGVSPVYRDFYPDDPCLSDVRRFFEKSGDGCGNYSCVRRVYAPGGFGRSLL